MNKQITKALAWIKYAAGLYVAIDKHAATNIRFTIRCATTNQWNFKIEYTNTGGFRYSIEAEGWERTLIEAKLKCDQHIIKLKTKTR